jgi:spermidine synthase
LPGFKLPTVLKVLKMILLPFDSGNRGDKTRLRTQIDRLFNSLVNLIYETSESSQGKSNSFMFSSRLLYGGTIFLGAFLLFLVEPIAAKQLLPRLGGSSAVWITCLVFFQVILLFGYLYAHWLAKNRNHHLAALIHCLFLTFCGLVVILRFNPLLPHAEAWPVTTIFLGLGLMIGLPFLALASTSPLLQVWMARSEGSAVPYKLFALSNFGSLLALGLYPSVIEPHISLAEQWLLWRIGFVFYLVFCAVVAWRTRNMSNHAAEVNFVDSNRSSDVPVGRYLLWFLLPAGAGMQLCATTSYLSQNLAAIPLLWIIPLAAYLLTFILAFEFPSIYRRSIVIRVLIVFVAGLSHVLSKTSVGLPISIGITFFLVELFVACFFCHAELYALRPDGVREATLFYLMIVAGGAAGTFFIGIVSPLLFHSNYDVPLSFLAVSALALAVTWNDGWGQRLLWSAGTVALFALLIMLHLAYRRDVLVVLRNFYGVLRVKESHVPAEAGTKRTLVNGSIEHGTEWFDEKFRDVPTTYYAEDSGVGLALRFCCGDNPRRIGVIGLGAGTLAAYGRSGDSIRFYEINPSVELLARHFFTYLRDSRAEVKVIEGDARVSLSAEAPQRFNVLVVDAFSGDAIPVHLLTEEAMELYRRHLAVNGILAFHISNQYVDLAPVVMRLAEASRMRARVVHSLSNEARGEFSATWALVSNDDNFFSQPQIVDTVTEKPAMDQVKLWTDDYSSLLPVLRLWPYGKTTGLAHQGF